MVTCSHGADRPCRGLPVSLSLLPRELGPAVCLARRLPCGCFRYFPLSGCSFFSSWDDEKNKELKLSQLGHSYAKELER